MSERPLHLIDSAVIRDVSRWWQSNGAAANVDLPELLDVLGHLVLEADVLWSELPVYATGQGADARVHTVRVGSAGFALLVVRIKSEVIRGNVLELQGRETLVGLDVRITTPSDDH